MAQLAAQMFIALDGVVQAPGHPDEDRTGGFAHGGWHTPFHTPQIQDWLVRNNEEAAAYLLGRHTYDSFKTFWPQATEDQVGPLGRLMNEKTKWVATSSLTEPLAWTHSAVLDAGDLLPAVRELKETSQGNLLLLGSTRLARALLEAQLVDRLHLVLDPVILGAGAKLFPTALPRPLKWTLTESVTIPTGTNLLTYQARPEASSQ